MLLTCLYLYIRHPSPNVLTPRPKTPGGFMGHDSVAHSDCRPCPTSGRMYFTDLFRDNVGKTVPLTLRIVATAPASACCVFTFFSHSQRVVHRHDVLCLRGVFGRFPPRFVQVYLNISGHLKLGCLAQAMVVAPKDDMTTPTNGIDGLAEVEGEVDMEIEVSKIPLTTSCWARDGHCSNFQVRI